MFVDHADSTELRQGDLIAKLLFPLPRVSDTRILGTLGDNWQTVLSKPEFLPALAVVGKSPTRWLTAQVHAAVSFCAVLGQCCEVAHDQNPPPKAFVVARLVPVPEGVRKRPELYRILKDNVDPYGSQRGFYALFYVGAHPLLDDELIVDFSQTMSVPWSEYSAIVSRKILQMDDVNRNKFRVKVGAYFGRAPDEDLNAGLADPWNPTDKVSAPTSMIQRLSRAIRIIRGKE